MAEMTAEKARSLIYAADCNHLFTYSQRTQVIDFIEQQAAEIAKLKAQLDC